MFKIPYFCFIHFYKIVKIEKTKETWYKTNCNIKVPNSEFPRVRYRIKYKCKTCPKSKYEVLYHDELSEEKLFELDSWIEENSTKEGKFSGQCVHGNPMGQPCKECGRE